MLIFGKKLLETISIVLFIVIVSGITLGLIYLAGRAVDMSVYADCEGFGECE